MRLPRMTTRRWMIAVAVVAVALGAEVMRQRSTSFRKGAAEYAKKEADLLWLARATDADAAQWRKIAVDARERGKILEKGFPGAHESAARAADTEMENAALSTKMADDWRKRAAIYANLKGQYRRAARYPWLPFQPDKE